MSDSVKKYHEMIQDGLISPDRKVEDIRQEKIMSLLSRAAKANKLAEVEIRATEVQKEYNTKSLLLGLEIACDEIL